jgi:chromosome segregation ATPase
MDVEATIEQLKSNLTWLENERRKDKTAIDSLEARLANLEGGVPPINQQLNQLNADVARTSAQLVRFDQIETTILSMRVETNRTLEAIEKTHGEREREMEKLRRADMETVNKSIGDVRKGLEPIPEIKKGVQARVEEEFRLARLIEEVDQKITEYKRSDEEYKRTLRILDEAHKQDNKRLTDLQGELQALRKRQDEQRGKVEMASESQRKLELRIGEVQAAETERRATQTNFIDKQTVWQVERDRTWKDMQTKFDDITKVAVNLDAQLQTLDATQRAVKRSQEAFDEITQRFERRLNEITEMQRLVEDRFRQEWVSYKADDQKRWTNYSLSVEEQQREFNRSFDKYNDRLVMIEDMALELRDLMHQLIEEEQKRLQGVVAAAHQWMDEFEKTFEQPRV